MTVYFIQAQSGHIKIGYTSAGNAIGRLRDLQVGNPLPLALLASCDGTLGDEAALHEEFASRNTSGEWFEPSPNLMSLISYVRAFGELQGWQRGPDAPVDLVRQSTRKAGVAVDEDNLWELAKRVMRATKPASALTFEDIVRLEWRGVAASASEVVEHMSEIRESGTMLDAFWSPRGAPAWRPYGDRGMATTAAALAETDHSEVHTAAVWVQAALRQMVGRKGSHSAIAETFPDAGWLLDAAQALHQVDYHHWVATTLPLSVDLPERCVLTAREFMRMVAVTQLATAGRYRVCASYVRGYARPIVGREAA